MRLWDHMVRVCLVSKNHCALFQAKNNACCFCLFHCTVSSYCFIAEGRKKKGKPLGRNSSTVVGAGGCAQLSAPSSRRARPSSLLSTSSSVKTQTVPWASPLRQHLILASSASHAVTALASMSLSALGATFRQGSHFPHLSELSFSPVPGPVGTESNH